ncbi:hypothetical protein ACHAWC_005523 [Mediolabrus comicus]
MYKCYPEKDLKLLL